MSDLRTLLDEAVPPTHEPVDVDAMWARARRQVATQRVTGVALVAAALLTAGTMLGGSWTTTTPVVGNDAPTAPEAPAAPGGSDPGAATLDDVFGTSWHDDWLYYFDTTNRLLRMRVDGSDREIVLNGIDEVTGTGGWDIDPRLSPDGSFLVFSREHWDGQSGDPAGYFSLYVARADGTDEREVTARPEHWAVIHPTWTPDRQRVVYVTFDQLERSPEEIHSIALDGSDDRFLAYGTDPEVSPDGRRIAYDHDGGVWTVDVDGTEDPRLLVAGGQDPAWSPDGSKLSYGTVDDTQVRIIDADGTHDRAVTGPDEGPLRLRSHPWWSPDGRWVMATAGRDVILVEVDGDRRIPLFTNARWGLTWWWGASD